MTHDYKAALDALLSLKEHWHTLKPEHIEEWLDQAEKALRQMPNGGDVDLSTKSARDEVFTWSSSHGFMPLESDCNDLLWRLEKIVAAPQPPAVDLDALKREVNEKLVRLIPNSYSDNTMLTVIDYLAAQGYLTTIKKENT